jgi:hypothetical protein
MEPQQKVIGPCVTTHTQATKELEQQSHVERLMKLLCFSDSISELFHKVEPICLFAFIEGLKTPDPGLATAEEVKELCATYEDFLDEQCLQDRISRLYTDDF